MTVKDLREQLDSLERAWTETDRQHLGEFEAQRVYCDVFASSTWNGVPVGGRYGGFGEPRPLFYDAQFGVMVVGRT